MKKQTKTNEKKKKGGVFKRVMIILLLIILIAGGIFAYKVHKNGGGLSGMLATTLGHDSETLNRLPKMYCLLIGESQNLTDTIILASYDPKTQEAAMLSIPRDTFIGDSRSNADTWDKINAVYQTKDGPEKLVKHVSNLTGIDVKYYLKVDTQALKVLVDEIGGVKFNVPIDMKYTDKKQGLYIDLKAGEQVLDGDKAEQVVRFRHNQDGTTYPASYGVQDLGRMKTQRDFLTAVAKQTLVPANITKIPAFMDIAKQYVETNLDFDAVKDYVPYAVNFNTDNLKSDKLPGISDTASGYWFYFVDKEETEKVVEKLFYGNIEQSTEEEQDENANTINQTSSTTNTSNIKKSEINIEVLNGSGKSSNLSEVVAELKAAGYNVIKTGETTDTAKTTIINRSDVPTEIEENIKQLLQVGTISTGQSSGKTNITIILGDDYTI